VVGAAFEENGGGDLEERARGEGQYGVEELIHPVPTLFQNGPSEEGAGWGHQHKRHQHHPLFFSWVVRLDQYRSKGKGRWEFMENDTEKKRVRPHRLVEAEHAVEGHAFQKGVDRKSE